MQTEPVLTETKKSSFSIVTVLLIVALLAAIGLGVWGFMLSNNVKATQSAYAELQSKHEALTKEKNTVSTDLETAKTSLDTAKKDLEKAKKDLADQQAALTKVQDEMTKLKANTDKAVKFLEVMSAYWVSDPDSDKVSELIEAIGDAELTKTYEAYQADGNKFSDWVKYVFVTISDLLATK